ncbi:hypothetical protein AMR77_25745 [Escherichia coli]|uniref:Envelope glycoprotein C n=1 Tax=Bovine alphaherpesvirus 2 TaxID=10295 RepID=A0A6H2U1A6_9ALPH|nr:hypothetical protein AMR77_25745 [Escherichia coli]QIC50128.1 glycoprotein C [Bovine alphaherpesvirus 2]QPO25253.1 envelope glycoprotein C [Bovine alphaherpesvirus 2]
MALRARRVCAVLLLTCVIAARVGEGRPRKSNRRDRDVCDSESVSAAHGMRLEIRCRVPRADDLRMQIWKYPLIARANHQKSKTESLFGKNDFKPPHGGELVFDNKPDSRELKDTPWAEGARPGSRLLRYSMLGEPPHQKLAIHALTNATQGLYYWVWGNSTNRYKNWTAVVVNMYRPPMLTMDAPPVLDGDRYKVTCTARDYYPNLKAEFTWYENDTVPVPPELVHTRVRMGSEGFTAVSTLTSASPALMYVTPSIRCQLVWQRDAVSYTRLVASADVGTLPRPRITMRFDEERATCEANCVPRSARALWLLGDDHVQTADAPTFHSPDGCPEHPEFGSLQSSMPVSMEFSEYTCRLAGYPDGVPVIEHSASHVASVADSAGSQVVTVLKTLGIIVAVCAALLAVVLVVVWAVRAAGRARRRRLR